MIDINNYEEYVLDYLEGELSSDTYQEMESFLNQNLTIKEEISDLLDFALPLDNMVTYDDKKGLQKRGGYIYWVIGSIVGLLIIGYILYPQNKSTPSIPNNKIEKYQTPQALEKESDTEYVINGLDKEEEIDKSNVVIETKNEKVVIQKSKKLNHIEIKEKAVEAVVSSDDNLRIVEDVQYVVYQSIIHEGNETKETIKKELAPKREKVILMNIATLNNTLESDAVASLNIDDILIRNDIKTDNSKSIDINLKLGRYVKTKNKIQSFLEKEAFVAVRDAITPEYFAKN